MAFKINDIKTGLRFGGARADYLDARCALATHP